MILLDASVVLSFAHPLDVHHERARKLIKDLQNGENRFLITDYVFNEIIGVTLRKTGKKAAVDIGEYLLRSTLILHTDSSLLKESWELFSKTQLNLSLVDCACIATVKRTKSEGIATFDKEFKKTGVPVFA